MKVYSCPLDEPTHAYEDMKNWQERDEKFRLEVKTKLLEMGYTGKLTGSSFYIPWADGAAEYMVMQKPNGSMSLVHIPIGDAWSVPEYMTRGVTKADVLRQNERNSSLPSLKFLV